MLKSHLTGVYDVTKTIVLRGGSRLSFLPTTVNRKERNALTLNWKGTVLMRYTKGVCIQSNFVL